MQDLKDLVTGKNHFGALELRVLDLLTPMTGETAPAVNAKFIGQTFINTAAGKQYVAVAVGSVTAGDDWVAVTSA